MKKVMTAVLIALSASAGIGTAAGQGQGNIPDISTLDPKAFRYVLPDNIPWRPAEGLTGTDSHVLVGNPGGTGFYIVLNRFQPGNFSRPHYHANDRYVMVLSGTWWAATGAKFDPENATVPIKPGTFVVHTGREVHYDGARAGGEPAIVMIFGFGPGTRVECEGPNAERGPGPCEEARRAAGIN